MVARDTCVSDDTSLCVCELHLPRVASLVPLALGVALWPTSVSNESVVGRSCPADGLLRQCKDHH